MDSKPFWQSKTFWGFFVAFVFQIAKAFGYELPIGPEEVADQITTIITTAAALFGIIGHALSKKKMTLSLT